MSESLNLDAQLAVVAARLAERRDTVLARWRAAVAADPQVAVADSLSRVQFIDHIPRVLQGLHDALLAGRARAPSAAAGNAEAGGGHGLHRWQQGYSLVELMREWSHLHLALIAEMQQFTEEHPGLDVRVINTAYRTIAVLSLEGMRQSTLEFERIRRSEAAGQLNDLRRSMMAARDIERRQAEILRGAAHDLRGNIGIVSTATAALNLGNLPDERRTELLDVAQRALRAHTGLLSDLMDLARLQAGYERRHIMALDVSRALRELCEVTLPIAHERGLYLRFEGPARLEVEADEIKLGRIVQNLLLNALHYTERGGVTVTWGDSEPNEPQRWRLAIRDTGPGIQRGSATPLADAIEQATQEAPEAAADAGDGARNIAQAEPAPPSSIQSRQGEGIGLSIVKRLCELLDATLEMQSTPGEGTVFAVVFPRRYGRN